MIEFTDRNLHITQVARDRKSKQLRLARKYLATARLLGLPDDSTTVRYWSAHLADWRGIPITAIVEDIQKKGQ